MPYPSGKGMKANGQQGSDSEKPNKGALPDALRVEVELVSDPDATQRLHRAYALILRSAAQQQALADPPTATSTKEGDPDADSSADG